MHENEVDHLPVYRVRPRFLVHTVLSPQELMDRLAAHLKLEGVSCKGRIDGLHYATLYLPAEVQHYWSPQLSLTIEEQANYGTTLRGLYGPNPSIWTMFVFFYCMIGFATLIVLMLGLSYLSLDLPASILWLVPILILLFLSLYAVAYLGQRKGHDQMLILHQFLESALEMDIYDKS